MNAVTYAPHPSSFDEGEFIAETIARFLEMGLTPHDIAIIYRTNRQSRAIEDSLIAHSIPYRIIGQAGFWARFYPRTIVGAFMLAAATKVDCLTADDLRGAIIACIDKPNRFLGKRTAEYAASINPADPVTGLNGCRLNARQRPSRESFIESILEARERIGTDPIADIISDLADHLGISNWLRESPAEDSDTPESNGDGQYPILTEIKTAMAEYGTDANAFLDYVKGQSASAAKSEDIPVDDGKVTLLTIHRAKGLEWDAVIVPGLVEGTLPHKMATTNSEIEEERRIAYVAFSRARCYLVVTTSNDSPALAGENGLEGISRFVGEADLDKYRLEVAA